MTTTTATMMMIMTTNLNSDIINCFPTWRHFTHSFCSSGFPLSLSLSKSHYSASRNWRTLRSCVHRAVKDRTERRSKRFVPSTMQLERRRNNWTSCQPVHNRHYPPAAEDDHVPQTVAEPCKSDPTSTQVFFNIFIHQLDVAS